MKAYSIRPLFWREFLNKATDLPWYQADTVFGSYLVFEADDRPGIVWSFNDGPVHEVEPGPGVWRRGRHAAEADWRRKMRAHLVEREGR